MHDLYREAELSWGVALPHPIRVLHNRDDEHVFRALQEVIYDMTSCTWEADSKIAWRIMQRRKA